MMLLLLGIGIWVVCSVLSYGLSFAYFQRKYPMLAKRDYRRDMLVCVVISLVGPMSLILTLINFRSFKYGMKFR